MKKYRFTFNGTFGTGTRIIEAKNKAEAIKAAKALYPFHGVNVSSFRKVKEV